ncbi:MAG: DUF302 domain-containing protein [Patescibacteria group bacterium]
MQYNYKKNLSLPFEEAVQKTKKELAGEGFGVLTEVDLKATLKNKLGVDYTACVILGACNPQFAYSSLLAENGISFFLPCNVVIQEESNQVSVGTILPRVLAKMVGNQKLTKITKIVEGKLKRVVDRV